MIVVIDTNVWVSALQFAKHRGTPTRALEKAMSEDVIATCDEIDAEIVRVLTEKFSWEQPRATSALQTILARGIRVKIRGTVTVLVLGAYKGTRIVTPSEYLSITSSSLL